MGFHYILNPPRIFLGHHKFGLYLKGPFLCILGSFLLVKVQNGGYFLGGC